MNEAADGVAPGGDAPSLPPAPPSPEPAQEPVEEALVPSEELVSSQAGSSADQADVQTSDLSSQAGNESASPTGKDATAVVRYGCMHNVGQFRHSLQPPPRRGQKVVIRTERGVELGEIIAAVEQSCADGCQEATCLSPERLESFISCNGRDYPLNRNGRILRLASAQDISDQEHLDRAGVEQLTYCKQEAAKLNLPMRLIAVEDLLGGERVIFYFTSESRVDFRELVRHLAGQYRTRIEMRQVGARDEARLVADYERCGQRCCCQQFIKSLQPVSIRMAKTQKATLDPSKISGRCGRLMCCLRYEDTGYEELRALLPRKNTWVRTADVVGKVLDGQILTQLVRLVAADGGLHVVANEAILERNVPAPPPTEPRARTSQTKWPAARPVAQPAPPPEQIEEELIESSEPELAEEPLADGTADAEVAEATTASVSADQGDQGKRRRRRRRRGKGKPATEAAGQQTPPPAAMSATGAAPTAAGETRPPGQKKRRHRRRRRGGGPSASASPPPTEPAN